MISQAIADPLSLFDVRDKNVVVTGASGTYGRTISAALSALGARVLMVSGSSDELATAAEEARGHGGEVVTHVARPDTPESADAIIGTAVEAFGTPELLVVASGMNSPAMIVDQPYDEWRRVIDANVDGPWLIAKAFGSRLIAEQRRGKVLLMSSVRGRLGNKLGYSGYCTSKGAIDALTRLLAVEWGAHGICVNGIAPTVFRSALTAWMFAESEQNAMTQRVARVPLGRLGEPEDLIGISLYLLSAASDFCTGQVIYVDGGYTAG